MTRQEKLDNAWEDYIAIMDPAYAAYRETIGPAWMAYVAIQVPAFAEYESKCKAIEAEYLTNNETQHGK